MEPLIRIEVKFGDAIQHEADVLVLKYAQGNYGVDDLVSSILQMGSRETSQMRPKPGRYSILNSVTGLAAKRILFVGVEPLHEFGYREIRDFSRKALTWLVSSVPDTRTVTMTPHGANIGLDEYEAFESQIAGLLDAIGGFDVSTSLRRISIVELNRGRAKRLSSLLSELLPEGHFATDVQTRSREQPETSERLRAAGYASEAKAHVFVAMPFKEEMSDIYDYGIQGAIRGTGFLCERADLSAFTGDVMQWVRDRIKSSKLVVADLTEANPNVYLEVGYAWGCGVPTILLVNGTKHLTFDVRGQRCLSYKRIKDLEESLKNELESLRNSGAI